MRTNSEMFENPSAGKFDPPPAPLEPRKPLRHRVRWGGLLVLAVPLAKRFFPLPSGWAYALWATLLVVGLALDWVLFKSEADEKGPYTGQDHLTR